jgi:Protein of unknown function (DUF1688)
MTEYSPLDSEFRIEGAGQSEVDYLLSAQAVRERARKILEMSLKGEGEFNVHIEKLDDVAAYVLNVIKEKYPDLKIPYHSRFNHFRVGNRDRMAELEPLLKKETPEERARIKIDLCVTSVLLDAGAGNDWKYTEDGHLYSRSEGLAVASYNMFKAGEFSSAVKSTGREKKLFADASGLMQITEEHINRGFQVSVGNPLLGAKGRAELLHRLGKVIESNDKYFAGPEYHRPGYMVDYLLKTYPNKKIEAEDLLKVVLHGLGGIWPGRIIMNDTNLGDTWRHPALAEGWEGFVPFHKLSQWMTYSLLEPLEEMGFKIINLNKLTALAEYRNGGLVIDSGLIEPKHDLRGRKLHPDSKTVIEWRALTIALLDEVAKVIRRNLKLSEDEFPLVKVLEGGTWWAGRKLAQEKRGGKPPFDIVSDGTVF